MHFSRKKFQAESESGNEIELQAFCHQQGSTFLGKEIKKSYNCLQEYLKYTLENVKMKVGKIVRDFKTTSTIEKYTPSSTQGILLKNLPLNHGRRNLKKTINTISIFAISKKVTKPNSLENKKKNKEKVRESQLEHAWLEAWLTGIK